MNVGVLCVIVTGISIREYVRVRCIHIGVGSDVVRSGELGSARASSSGMNNR
jgi:hypothetical protein